MPYKFETDKKRIPASLDRRRAGSRMARRKKTETPKAYNARKMREYRAYKRSIKDSLI